jgi:hypothetical protein
VHFALSAVLEYDVTCLAPGQMVSFDLEMGAIPTAVNVCVQKQNEAVRTDARPPDLGRLRYMGFEQKASIRAYRFDRISHGEDTITLVVATDMALFTKHHIAIQEGPTLCLELLMAEAGTAGPARLPRTTRWLTDENLVAHLANRPVVAPRSHIRRTPARPAPGAEHAGAPIMGGK